MTDWMETLLQMSIQGAALIAALMVLRRLFQRRAAPTVLYALWLLPAARLLIPGSIPSVWSLQNLFSPAVEQRAAAVLRQPVVQGPLPAATAPPAAEVSAAVVQTGASFSVGSLLAVLWALGAAAILLAALWKNLTFLRQVRRGAVRVEADCALPVYLSEHLASPCLCGLFHPAIYLGDEALESQAHFELVLRHELAHCRSGDRFWALLRLLCCAVHWFNPLVWIGARAAVEDCERACDHRVLRRSSQQERETYGLMLLSYLKRPREQSGVLTVSSPMGGRALRSRIALIGRRPAMRKTAAAALAALTALVVLAACTGRMAEEKAGNLQRLAQLAEEGTAAEGVELPGGGAYGAASGQTFGAYLDSLNWAEADQLQPEQLEPQMEVRLTGAGGTLLGTLQFLTDRETGAYYGAVTLSGEDTAVYYAASEEDAQTAWAMTQLQAEGTLRSDLPGGGQMVLVSSPPALGSQRHWLFYTEDRECFLPISSDLNDVYPRVAENMLFLSGEVGFLSFRFEEINGLRSPNFYRTEDGGATWERVELPMMDVTTDSGYTGMHVTAMEFSDDRRGVVTVSMARWDDSTADTLSCLFVTGDGGRTWGTVTSGGPAVQAD